MSETEPQPAHEDPPPAHTPAPAEHQEPPAEPDEADDADDEADAAAIAPVVAEPADLAPSAPETPPDAPAPVGAVLLMPLPGEPGYAPPARVAMPAGVVLQEHHYGLAPIGVGSAAVTGLVPLAMPPPAQTPVSTDAALTRPSQMTAQSATAQLHKMVGDLGAWISDLPHEVFGEAAVVVQLFRDLSARRAALGAATALGRSLAPDAVDLAVHVPPLEFFRLRQAAAHVVELEEIYAATLAKTGSVLSAEDQMKIDQIKEAFTHLVPGSTALPEAALAA